MLAGQRGEKVNSARMIEEQLGLGVADNLRHLARELAIGDSQGVGRDVHVRILSWLPEAWISHMSLRQMPRANPEGRSWALVVLPSPIAADCPGPEANTRDLRVDRTELSNGKRNRIGHRPCFTTAAINRFSAPTPTQLFSLGCFAQHVGLFQSILRLDLTDQGLGLVGQHNREAVEEFSRLSLRMTSPPL